MDNYSSCSKIPNGKSKPTNELCRTPNTTFYELVSVANTIFGEGQWCHSISNQTIDFIDYISSKYCVGCASTIKVLKDNQVFHEDIGYSYKEGPIKGITIMNARMDSINNALQRALACFDYRFETCTASLKTVNDEAIPIIIRAEDFESTVPSALPSATSTPLPRKSSPQLPVAGPTNLKINLEYPNTDSLKNSLTEEELNRMERKRKQFEKQREFKKLMQEKENQKKSNAPPKPKF